jgi:hypothetical protein
MVAKNWSIKRCADKFRRLCGIAFTPRTLQKFPILRHLITLKLATKYQTIPFRDTLQKTFEDEPLFGSSGQSPSYHGAKIAVTATDKAGTRAIIIANYSRNDGSRIETRPGEYEFLRPDRPRDGLTIADAAAATSAAPSYFKPFEHGPTKRTYLDGAIYHNNPVRLLHRERKLLWPDVANQDPDIFLSIGTSQHKAGLQEHLSGRSTADSAPTCVSQYAPFDVPNLTDNARRPGMESSRSSRRRAFPMMPQIFTTMVSGWHLQRQSNEEQILVDSALTSDSKIEWIVS